VAPEAGRAEQAGPTPRGALELTVQTVYSEWHEEGEEDGREVALALASPAPPLSASPRPLLRPPRTMPDTDRPR